MIRSQIMRHFAKWPIWIGWLVGAALLIWRGSGRVMFITPIAEVRGHHLPIPAEQEALPSPLSPLTPLTPPAIVAANTIGSIETQYAGEARFDFRRSIPAWQARLQDGMRISVTIQTGEIAAIRTIWWRVFAALGVIGSWPGCVLIVRRQRAARGLVSS